MLLAASWAHVLAIVAIAVGGFALFNVLIFFIPHFWLRPDRGGERRKGLVIWVEPLRFLGIRWGARSAAAGLRRAGFAGEFLYWAWHNGVEGTLLLPALRNRRLIEREAARLADFLGRCRAEDPQGRIYLMGYSAGGYVAMRALELLPKGVAVDAAAALSSAFSPWRDLSAAAAHVRGKLLVSASLGDCWVLGLGTLVFGNADGVHSPGVGMLGHLGPRRANAERPAGIIQRHWRPAMLRQGLLGMHDWSMLPAFIRDHVAPTLEIPRAERVCTGGRSM